MSKDEKVSRRTFLKRFAAGAVAGGAIGAATAPDEDKTDTNKPDNRRKIPMWQRVTGGALMGGLLTNLAFRKASNQEKHTARQAEEIGEEVKKGREWELRQSGGYRGHSDEFDREL